MGSEINLRDKKYAQTKKYFAETANRTTEKIKVETNGQRFSLKLDIAIKSHKSVSGINIRYFIGENIVE